MKTNGIQNKDNNDYLIILEICLFINSSVICLPINIQKKLNITYTITNNNIFSKHS